MNSVKVTNPFNNFSPNSPSSNSSHSYFSKPLIKNERKLLKALLLGRLDKLFGELFHNKIQYNNNSMECYAVDSKIIQILISDIVETGEYTLEGIANHTRIPFDIIFEAACGRNQEFSITPWAKIVDLYIQVKPEVAKILFDKFLLQNNNCSNLSLFLNE